MNAGLLTEIIEVYETVVTTNEYGELVTTKRFKIRTRARLEHLRKLYSTGVRDLVNDEIVYPYVLLFTVRLYHNINNFDIIKWNNNYYRIVEVVPDKRAMSTYIKTELINE